MVVALRNSTKHNGSIPLNELLCKESVWIRVKLHREAGTGPFSMLCERTSLWRLVKIPRSGSNPAEIWFLDKSLWLGIILYSRRRLLNFPIDEGIIPDSWLEFRDKTCKFDLFDGTSGSDPLRCAEFISILEHDKSQKLLGKDLLTGTPLKILEINPESIHWAYIATWHCFWQNEYSVGA